MNRIELKAMAKQQISGNIGALFVCMLICIVISSAVSAIPSIGAIATIVISAPLDIGLITIFLKLRNGEPPKLLELFNHFDVLAHAILLYILIPLFTFLWSLLFVIPGIIASLSYSMAPYILAENKSFTAMEALNASKKMMNGHKADLFILYLSFIGWGLLVSVTFGIAGIYVFPYMEATKANFYYSIKENYTDTSFEVYDA
ncbi:MAG: DUF975 family protein [Clostridia bacterium]|nr:DUF975 family protein [Clostridia bacterium]